MSPLQRHSPLYETGQGRAERGLERAFGTGRGMAGPGHPLARVSRSQASRCRCLEARRATGGHGPAVCHQHSPRAPQKGPRCHRPGQPAGATGQPASPGSSAHCECLPSLAAGARRRRWAWRDPQLPLQGRGKRELAELQAGEARPRALLGSPGGSLVWRPRALRCSEDSPLCKT